MQMFSILIVSVLISWLCYCTIVLQDIIIGETGQKVYGFSLYYSFQLNIILQLTQNYKFNIRKKAFLLYLGISGSKMHRKSHGAPLSCINSTPTPRVCISMVLSDSKVKYLLVSTCVSNCPSTLCAIDIMDVQ